VGEQWLLAVFPQKSSAIMVNVGGRGSVRGCMGVTTMTKERRQHIDLTDEETGQNELLRATVADPNRGITRG
jgi:hypothetical protein